MDLTNNKPCIISCGIGGHYTASIDRLANSVQWHGWPGSTIFWKDYPEGCPKHEGSGQYNFKIFSFREAFKRGHNVVLWVDSSLYAIKDVMPIFDYINDNGIFLFKSGYPLSATTTDAFLSFKGITRESLIDVPEFATGAVGIRIDNPIGNEFFIRWEAYMKWGFFCGNRVHDPLDSTHPLFKFSRQDQTACSMALHDMGITTAGEDKNWVSYYPNHTESTIFFIKGI